jgi:polyphosphate kinase
MARAKALASGLQGFTPPGDLPAPLWEAAYLLEEAQKEQRPLVERLRILGLMATSLDQLFVDQVPGFQSGDPGEQKRADDLAARTVAVDSLLRTASAHLQDHLLPLLAREHGVHLLIPQNLDPEDQNWLVDLFHERVFPLLTPLAIDPGHPFPFISSFSLNLLVALRWPEANVARPVPIFARVKVPRLLPHFIQIPRQANQATGRRQERIFIQSEELVRFFLAELFPGLDVESAYLFRVLRTTEPGMPPLLPEGSRPRQRQKILPVVRLDTEQSMPAAISGWLIEHLHAPAYACYRSSAPIAQLHLVEFANLIEEFGETLPLS